MKRYFVYIITNKYNRVLYSGVTSDLSKRIYEHKNKLIKGFSSKYNLCKLVYFEEFKDISEAITNEKKLKGWLRKRKIELINNLNQQCKDLAEDI